jgi:hypothetical protein
LPTYLAITEATTMANQTEREELERLKKLEGKAEHEIEALEDTQKEIREEIAEIDAQEEARPFDISVNNKPVRIVGHEHTGLQIKEAAIAAGVRVQLDFVLSEELKDGRSRIIGDTQRIRVEPSACFEAIPNDDHS